MSLSILAVDDSRTIRDMLRLTLERAGHQIALAEDGLDGLETLDRAAQDKRVPDVVITDINMPRLDGLGFIRAVRDRTDMQRTPILVLSTENATALKAQARAAGATGWIVKPFDPDRLLRALAMVAG